MKKWGNISTSAPVFKESLWISIATGLAVAGVVIGAIITLWWALSPTVPVEPPVVTAPSIEEPVVEEPAPVEPVVEDPAPIEEPIVEPVVVEKPPAPVEPIVVTPPTEEPPALPALEIPSNFIVPDEVWENAFLLNKVDGTPYKGFIGFSDIPIGTELYAPMDGYIHYFRTLNEKNETVDSVAILTQSATYPSDIIDVREVYFFAKEIRIINAEPKEGEVFAIILNNSEMSSSQYGWYNRKTSLAVSVDDVWAELSDRNITDPLTYFWLVVQTIKPAK